MYSTPSPETFDLYDEPRLHMERLLRTHLIELDISMRILIPLEDAGVRTLGDLIKLTPSRLRGIRRMGELSAQFLENIVKNLGLSLAEE